MEFRGEISLSIKDISAIEEMMWFTKAELTSVRVTNDPAKIYLEQLSRRDYIFIMPKSKMKVLGGNVPPYWERFNRLQSTARLLSKNIKRPRGIFRFKSYEEFDEWKMKYSLNHQGHPPKTTS